MATVFALIFLPALLAVLGMALAQASTVVAAIGFTTFGILAAAMFVALFRMMQRWENESVD